MFYGSPFPPQQPSSNQPSPLSPGIPPAGMGGAAAKPPEEVAFQEARAAIKVECRDNIPQLMGETKKLSVAVLEAWDLMLVAGRRGVEMDPVEVLRQEMQNQVMAYALMRFLPDEACKSAAEGCGAKIPLAMQENPPVGKAGGAGERHAAQSGGHQGMVVGAAAFPGHDPESSGFCEPGAALPGVRSQDESDHSVGQ